MESLTTGYLVTCWSESVLGHSRMEDVSRETYVESGRVRQIAVNCWLTHFCFWDGFEWYKESYSSVDRSKRLLCM